MEIFDSHAPQSDIVTSWGVDPCNITKKNCIVIYMVYLRQTKISVALEVTTYMPIPAHFTNFKLKSVVDKCVRHTVI